MTSRFKTALFAALITLTAAPALAGPVTGAVIGAGGGALIAGPPGAVVGAVVGAVAATPRHHGRRRHRHSRHGG